MFQGSGPEHRGLTLDQEEQSWQVCENYGYFQVWVGQAVYEKV